MYFKMTGLKIADPTLIHCSMKFRMMGQETRFRTDISVSMQKLSPKLYFPGVGAVSTIR